MPVAVPGELQQREQLARHTLKKSVCRAWWADFYNLLLAKIVLRVDTHQVPRTIF